MKKKITFEEGMQELEALVHGLETGELSLEDSFKAYEKAVALKNSLSALLDEGDKRIRVLTESGETVLDAQMDTEEAP
jgi:exodeoxyribonuclease VII small subunit